MAEAAVDVRALLSKAAATVRTQVSGPEGAAANTGIQTAVPAQAPTAPPPAAPAAAPPGAAVPPAATTPATSDPARDDKGRFAVDPNLAAQREVIKRQQTELKALREQVKNRMTTPVAPTTQAADPMAEVIASMPPDTQAWWKTHGQKAVSLQARAEAQALLSQYQPALEAAGNLRTQEQAQNAYESNYSDWRAEVMGDGEIVNDAVMLPALDAIEKRGWRLGPDDASHFSAVLALTKAQNPSVTVPVLTGQAAADAAARDAADRARAGGLRPGAAATPPPSNQIAEQAKALREASWQGDQNTAAAILRERLRGINPLVPKAPAE